MVTLTIFILFLSFYVFINTSKRAHLSTNLQIEPVIKKHPFLAKITATFLLIASYIIFYTKFGLGAGTLLFFITLITLGSTIILVNPIKLINYKTIFLFFGMALSMECLIF